MEPEIFEDDYYSVETTAGTWIVPVSVSGRVKSNAQLSDYVGGTIQSRKLVKGGFVCRMSMPGYLDCTDWSGFETEKECREHLEDMYGADAPDEEDSDD
jgi:hypothetical protein